VKVGELHVREEDDMDIGRLCNGGKRTRVIFTRDYYT
jgi:hypothetical protein